MTPASPPLDSLSVSQDAAGRDLIALAQSRFVGQWWTGAVCVTAPGNETVYAQADLRAGVAAVDWLRSAEPSSGAIVASGSDDGSVDLWAYSEAGASRSLQHVDGRHAHDDIVSCVSAARDDKLASSSWDKSVIIWSATSFLEHDQPLLGHTDLVHSVRWTDAAGILLSASQDRSVRQWDTRAGSASQCFRTKQAAFCAIAVADSHLLVAGDECGAITFFDDRKNDLQLSHLPNLHRDVVRAIACSPAGNLLASCGDDGRICIMPTGTLPLSEERIQVRTPHAEGTYIRSIAYGKQGLYSCGWDGKLAHSADVKLH